MRPLEVPSWVILSQWLRPGGLIAIRAKGDPYVTIADADDRGHEAGGVAAGTQATCIDAVRKLAAHYRRSPDQLSEEEVRAYLVGLRERGAARGTFKTNSGKGLGGLFFSAAWRLRPSQDCATVAHVRQCALASLLPAKRGDASR